MDKPERTEHHIWCNNWLDRQAPFALNPVEGCRQCAKLWALYPYDDTVDPEALLFKHFPEAVVRKGT